VPAVIHRPFVPRRYISSDPIGIVKNNDNPLFDNIFPINLENGEIDLNHLYVYGLNNPLMFIDPYGLEGEILERIMRHIARPEGQTFQGQIAGHLTQ